MKLVFTTPETPEELGRYYDDLKFLFCFLPPDVKCDTREFIRNYAGFCTLCHSGKLVIGSFVLFPVQGNSKRSVEIHGVYRQDLKQILGRADARALMDHIWTVILDDVFINNGLEKIIAKITPEAKLARVWVRRHGFEQVPNTDRGRTVWKLERRKYLNGRI